MPLWHSTMSGVAADKISSLYKRRNDLTPLPPLVLSGGPSESLLRTSKSAMFCATMKIFRTHQPSALTSVNISILSDVSHCHCPEPNSPIKPSSCSVFRGQ